MTPGASRRGFFVVGRLRVAAALRGPLLGPGGSDSIRSCVAVRRRLDRRETAASRAVPLPHLYRMGPSKSIGPHGRETPRSFQ